MKRHPSLQPLSRDHHEALLQVQMLRSAAEGSPDDRRVARVSFRDLWDGWFRDHLDLEERRLPPLIPAAGDVDRLRKEHDDIRFLAEEFVRGAAEAEPAGALMLRLAERLHDHIRWEERQLFPAIEQATGEEKLRSLGVETKIAEAGRPRSCRPKP
ncbi:MAG: hemerythrin domain-containing protein [Acidobacteria bacterium]|nr:hemerythrin domain-containing protein [Acidobacteriota bacterium]